LFSHADRGWIINNTKYKGKPFQMGWRLFLRLTLVIKYRRSNKKMLLIHWNELAKLNDKWVIDCCLTQNEQVFSYITLRTASIQLYHVENSKYSAISRWEQQVFSYITLRTASIQLYHVENKLYFDEMSALY
jgi:hypothetical protein